jgi:hypothetical protein
MLETLVFQSWNPTELDGRAVGTRYARAPV